ncbi:MAG: metallophosphoesterase [Clostridia bacterium]|nr:metallophosphoesterase [Clostridia bacterium]
MKKIISALLSLILVISLTYMAFAVDNSKELKFREDGTFKILQISDTQDDAHPAYDMIEFVKLSIKESKPDLIIFTGDLVEDKRPGDLTKDDDPFHEGVVVKNNQEKTTENLEKAADSVLSILQESGIPFALAQGNNDHNCGISDAYWLKIYSRYSNCLTTDMSNDSEGRIDYNILINGTDGSPAFNLWIMDTERGGTNTEQDDWYKQASTELTNKYGKVIPAFVFEHIQVCDIGNLFEECSPFDEGAKACGSKVVRLNREIATGYNFFGYEPGLTSQQFLSWKEQGDVIGAFFGHQHVEGFSGKVEGIELGFTYGCEFAKTGPYGYRVFTLHEDDILNYDNELFTYEGSVKTGNARIEKQAEISYKEYKNPAEKAFYSIINFVKFAISFVIDIFA